jgi:tRNA modification GTPase
MNRAGGAETVFALASGAGRAGVAMVRVSGPGAGGALQALTGKALPKPRFAALRTLSAPLDQTHIDDALVLWFPGPASFTGEDCAEFHVHGGPAVVTALIDALARLPGLGPAEPGAFTRRAFEHGKLDLAQAEGLADLVDAETEAQRRQALRQIGGGLSRLYEGWRAQLIPPMALLEAAIDFPEEDLPADLAARVAPLLGPLRAAMRAHLQDRRGEQIRDGFTVAILGAPNAGKSSLLNALAGRDAAIVSPIPGTTRDVVEVRLVLDGCVVWIADTAGLRDAADIVEAEGVRRALARAETADLRMGLVEAGQAAESALQAAMRPGDIWIASKADLDGAGPAGAIALSTQTGAGLGDVLAALTARAAGGLDADAAPALTRARHRRLVETALAALDRADASIAFGPEIAAEDLRAAAAALGKLTGRIDVEDLLEEVFAKFCIGK